MSYADTARDALRAKLREASAPIHAAGVSFMNAMREALKAEDLVDAMQHAVGVILAAEHLGELATEAGKQARAVLCEQMSETGATTIQTAGQTAYISRKAAWVSIDQEDMMPPEFMKQPPPSPDKKAIKAAIEAGEDVPGCSIVRPNDYSLVIRGKS